MLQLGQLLEAEPVQAQQTRDGVPIHYIVHLIQHGIDRGAKQAGLGGAQGPAPHISGPQEQEIRHDAHGDLPVVALDHLGGVELSGPAGAQELEIIEWFALAVVGHGPQPALLLIAPDVDHEILQRVVDARLATAAGTAQQFGWHETHGIARQIAFNPDGLDLLDPLDVVPGTVGCPEH